jgi:hypothetical protein
MPHCAEYRLRAPQEPLGASCPPGAEAAAAVKGLRGGRRPQASARTFAALRYLGDPRGRTGVQKVHAGSAEVTTCRERLATDDDSGSRGHQLALSELLEQVGTGRTPRAHISSVPSTPKKARIAMH